MANSAKFSSDFVSPSSVNRFIFKNTQAQSTGLLGLHRTQAQIAESAVTDIFASIRKDWFGHPFHLLNGSPLPFALSLVFFFSALHLISVLRLTSISAFAHGFWLIVLAAVIITWCFEAFTEENSAAHTIEVQRGFRIGILLFIVSELMLFISFFWGWFHVSLNPSIWIGGVWAPTGIEAFYWWRVPFLNTLLLLSSGLSLTVAHFWVVSNDKLSRLKLWTTRLVSYFGAAAGADAAAAEVSFQGPKNADRFRVALLAPKLSAITHLNTIIGKRYFFSPTGSVTSRTAGFSILWVFDTVIRGTAFLVFQVFEYIASFFTISDSVYGSLFFSLTGLHGFHVFVGVIFLAMSLFSLGVTNPVNVTPFSSLTMFSFTSGSLFRVFTHRVAFDGAVWYWHFVDVIWLFVLLFIYWWGANASSACLTLTGI